MKQTKNRKKAAAMLGEKGTRFLTVLWCDSANVIRSKAVHIPTLLKNMTKGGSKSEFNEKFLSSIERRLTVSKVQQSVPVVFDAPVPEAGLEPVREIRLVPDWATLVRPGYMPGNVMAIGDLVDDEKPWTLCPRAMLRRAVDRLGGIGYGIRTGVEIEFFLLYKNDDGTAGGTFPVPYDRDLFAQNSAFVRESGVINDIADELFAQGIDIANYNIEAGPGQHEISLAHSDPMTVADSIVYARETIKAAAGRHGLEASFVPKLFEDSSGSGSHFHISLWSGGRNVLADRKGPMNLSKDGRSFIAGILRHLPGLMAMTAPTVNSFRRIRPHAWSGAFRVWGVDNKEAAIRVPHNPFGEGPERFEFKTADLTANPYVALAGIIAAGADGIAGKHTLSDPIEKDPANYTKSEMKKLGIEPLPASVTEAVKNLDNDLVLRDAFGEEYYRVYKAVKLFEERELKNLTLEEERKILLTRY